MSVQFIVVNISVWRIISDGHCIGHLTGTPSGRIDFEPHENYEYSSSEINAIVAERDRLNKGESE